MRPVDTPIVTDERGDESHPSWGVLRLHRTQSTPGRHLFGSSVPHSEFVVLDIAGAHRKRDLHKDWVFGDITPIVSVSMSLAQWGAVTSSFNQGEGTPITVDYAYKAEVPSAANDIPRLAVTSREVKETAEKSVAELQEAIDDLLAVFEANEGRRAMRSALDTLRHRAKNLPANMKFAADKLTEHAEKVVAAVKADIEAERLTLAADRQRKEIEA